MGAAAGNLLPGRKLLEPAIVCARTDMLSEPLPHSHALGWLVCKRQREGVRIGLVCGIGRGP